jgi:hypothetical protein
MSAVARSGLLARGLRLEYLTVGLTTGCVP